MTGEIDNLLMARDADGYCTSFVSGAHSGDAYHFYVVGEGSSSYKRDPYARAGTGCPVPEL
jgi:1,4-alpha-glucan branching enzyme